MGDIVVRVMEFVDVQLVGWVLVVQKCAQKAIMGIIACDLANVLMRTIFVIHFMVVCVRLDMEVKDVKHG
jgi:hypothetical protein